jgi:hypothetical protein
MSETIAVPTEEEINAIPSENWMAWLRAEYNNYCCEPDYISITTEKEEIQGDHAYMISFKTFCTGLNQTYCDVTPEQYEKVKSGFYNNQVEDLAKDYLKMVSFMEYKKKYPDDDKIFFKKIGIDEDGDDDEDWIWLKGGKAYEFRPDIKWDDLNKVIDYIESKPSTLMTSIEYLDSDRHKYTFKILMKDGVTAEGLTSGTSKESKIDAAYKGVMNYINWRTKLDEDGKD